MQRDAIIGGKVKGNYSGICYILYWITTEYDTQLMAVGCVEPHSCGSVDGGSTGIDNWIRIINV